MLESESFILIRSAISATLMDIFPVTAKKNCFTLTARKRVIRNQSAGQRPTVKIAQNIIITAGKGKRSRVKEREVELNFNGAKGLKTVTRGVPQGSSCGPGFWNILMDGIFETDMPRGATLTCFADDCLIVVVDRNIGINVPNNHRRSNNHSSYCTPKSYRLE